MKDKLKPCPFCEGKADEFTEEDTVFCGDCGVSQASKEIWNTRPSPLNWRKPEDGLRALRGETFLLAFIYSSDEENIVYYETAQWFNDEEVRLESGTLLEVNEILGYIKIPNYNF